MKNEINEIKVHHRDILKKTFKRDLTDRILGKRKYTHSGRHTAGNSMLYLQSSNTNPETTNSVNFLRKLKSYCQHFVPSHWRGEKFIK